MSRSTKYAFRLSMHRELDAQAVGDFLDALIDDSKEHVTAEEIVAAARKRDCPLHAGFTWSDPEAAEKWRRREAKWLVSNLMVEKNGERTRTRAFVYVAHPEHDGKRVLLTMQSALARPEMKEQVRAQIVRRFQRSLSYYSEMFGSTRQLRALAKDIAKLQKKAERELMVAV